MAYQITVILSDQEYAALKTEAAKSGKQPEMLLHEIMAQRLQAPPIAKHPLTGREFMEQQYHEGKLLNLPMRRGLSQEKQTEIERLGRLFGGGKPLSEMVIEDRGSFLTFPTFQESGR